MAPWGACASAAFCFLFFSLVSLLWLLYKRARLHRSGRWWGDARRACQTRARAKRVFFFFFFWPEDRLHGRATGGKVTVKDVAEREAKRELEEKLWKSLRNRRAKMPLEGLVHRLHACTSVAVGAEGATAGPVSRQVNTNENKAGFICARSIPTAAHCSRLGAGAHSRQRQPRQHSTTTAVDTSAGQRPTPPPLC